MERLRTHVIGFGRKVRRCRALARSKFFLLTTLAGRGSRPRHQVGNP
jgi:hypothetical protein